MRIPKEKKWARGMTQEEFKVAWLRKNPNADVIPVVEEWLYKAIPTGRCIDPVLPEQYKVGD